jgi:isopenicillin N synthase-like dioxygenase
VTIPTIDLAPFFAGTPAERRAIAAAVDGAGRDLGFLRVRGLDVPDELRDRCVATALRFFALPADAKRRCGPAGPACFNGYWGPESELSGALFGAARHFDLKEKFKISRPDETHAFDPARPQVGWAYQPNRWPAEIPEFAPVFVAFYRAMEQAALSIMRVMAAALDMPAEWFNDKLDRHESTATWNHYPPQQAAPEEGQLRSSAHRDIGSITLLIEGSGPGLAAGGLEIQDRDGRWLPVAYEPGTIMVNIGDLLRRWTNDRWTSALHRVANPPGDRARLGRVSLAYFQKPNFHASLAAVPSCVSAGNPQRHAVMPAGEYMRYRMLHSVGVIEGLDAVFEPALMQAADPGYGRVRARD